MRRKYRHADAGCPFLVHACCMTCAPHNTFPKNLGQRTVNNNNTNDNNDDDDNNEKRMHSSASHFKPVLHKNDTDPKSNDVSLKKMLAQAGKIV